MDGHYTYTIEQIGIYWILHVLSFNISFYEASLENIILEQVSLKFILK